MTTTSAEEDDGDPLESIDLEAVRLAVEDLAVTYPHEYDTNHEIRRQLSEYQHRFSDIREKVLAGDATALAEARKIAAFSREALLANPLLDFDKLLLIKREPEGGARRAKGKGYGLGIFLGLPNQSSWQVDRIPRLVDWKNEIAVLSPVRPDGKLKTLFAPPKPRLVGDIDLHFNGKKLLFSMPDDNLRWQVHEIPIDGSPPRQLSPAHPGVHNFDAVYLPNDRIAFVSTAPLQGVPCNKTVNVGMLYLMDRDGENIRQLAFDQDHNYSPTVTNDGRILYLRWEYTDIPHVWARYLFTMNPDGSGQRELYGSGSYWPNSIFYARPVPSHPSKVVGIVTGHHVGRVGQLVLFDPAISRRESDGVVQRIPGRGESVEPKILDRLTMESWPKFLHPYPLSEKYFLVAAKPGPDNLWGIYLVDVFDNMVLIKESEGDALLEPIPLRTRPRPPVIPENVDLSRKDALVQIADIYAGAGMSGVPRGTVRKLRLFTYHFAYQTLAGISHRVGADGPWEPKRVLGTVTVEADGSALFRVPANTPISIQPLDADGAAVQLMRSWMTAMPGENVSCVGCHDNLNTAPPSRAPAEWRDAADIEPWHGPERGFSFKREVQPVLDRHCIACHNGDENDPNHAEPDLQAHRDRYVVLKNQDPAPKVVNGVPRAELFKNYNAVFEPSYMALRSFVRVGGFESDIRLLDPGEFHANTSELVQMLRKGHYGVQLDEEAWDRLLTWIDLNAPCHGTWRETAGAEQCAEYRQRRLDLRELYGGDTNDPEDVPGVDRPAVVPIKPAPTSVSKSVIPPPFKGWPFDNKEANRRQQQSGPVARKNLELGNGVILEMVLVPAGEFVMGDAGGHADEQPLTRVRIDRPFWMSRYEITNEQYQQFDAAHDSGFEHKGSWVFSEKHLGWLLNQPKQPVVRVSQQEAEAFCRWLSKRANVTAMLPTEAQWEYACRAGSAEPMSYGDPDADFSEHANMADATIRQLAYDTDGRFTADLVPRDSRANDNALVTANVGTYQPNAWGLHDMHGNVWEWTRSAYRPYPYDRDDGRNSPGDADTVVARGGSWRDRPQRCRSAYRLSFPDWQRVFNVGFRVICEVSE